MRSAVDTALEIYRSSTMRIDFRHGLSDKKAHGGHRVSAATLVKPVSGFRQDHAADLPDMLWHYTNTAVSDSHWFYFS